MNSYETTLIFNPELQDEGWNEAVTRYTGIIADRKGEIKRTDLWGLRRLAYPIQKQTQGYYVQFVHQSPADVPREIERRCLLDETCLRYLTVVADNPRYLEEQEKRLSARDAVPATPAVAGAASTAVASIDVASESPTEPKTDAPVGETPEPVSEVQAAAEPKAPESPDADDKQKGDEV